LWEEGVQQIPSAMPRLGQHGSRISKTATKKKEIQNSYKNLKKK
jgi:hypothetical protein